MFDVSKGMATAAARLFGKRPFTLVVLVATFVGAPVIVALMIPEIYRWLRRAL